VLSITVLIGAALNASFDRVFPESSTAGARLELVRRLRDRSGGTRASSGPREADLADDTSPG
jgi:membrane protein